MPADLNEQNQDVHPNTELSELDKAHILIHCPHNDSMTKAWTIDEALQVTDVDQKLQRTIYVSGNHNPDYWKQIRTQLHGLLHR
jgi:hypothetical protein